MIFKTDFKDENRTKLVSDFQMLLLSETYKLNWHRDIFPGSLNCWVESDPNSKSQKERLCKY